MRDLLGCHPCERCGEDTLNDELCRDCQIDADLEACCCQACGTLLLYMEDIGLRNLQTEAHGHTRACPWVAL